MSAAPLQMAAHDFRAFGLKVIATDNKKTPIVNSWADLRNREQIVHDVDAMDWKQAKGIAGLGRICIDIDGATDKRALETALTVLGLPPDYEWAVKTPGKLRSDGSRLPGYHIWLDCPDLNIGKMREDRPARFGADHIELRTKDVYAMLPGSQHPDGGYYDFISGCFPTNPPAMIDDSLVIAAYDAITIVPAPQPQPKAQPHQTAHSSTNGNGASDSGYNPWYVRAAITKELDELTATRTHRNNKLNDSAYSLAGYLWTNVITEAELEDRLLQAAIANGYVAKDGETEARKSIRSGIERGKAKPKHVPAPKTQDLGGADQFAQDLADKAKTAHSTTVHTNGNGTAPHTATNSTGPTAASNGNAPNAGSSGQQSAPSGTGAAASTPAQNLYFISSGTTWYNKAVEQKDGTIDYKPVPIASFTATIATEIVDEAGTKHYVIEGQTSRGGKFTAQIAAEAMSDDRKLRAVLEAAAGPQETVYARMGAHLSPAIRLLTTQVEHTRHYDRTGWDNGGEFLIPGREPSGTEIALPEKLPYNLAPIFDVQVGLAALADLMEVIPPHKATVILSHVLVSPLAKLADLHNERAGLNIEGGTGRFKTSTTQQYMSIWGAKFGDDDSLLKWGQGATGNALMKYATHAHDMPFLIDNYKPTTGEGEKGFVNLIHNILEGGERERLDRNAQLRAGKPISCWPIVTGEDLPRNDAASLARILVIQYENAADCNTQLLTRLQANNEHLPAIGAMWLDWLESADGRKAAQEAGKRFADTRKQWVEFLAKRAPSTVNPHRVASNLAVNELAFIVATQHPQFGSILAQYAKQHVVGLEEIALNMGKETTGAQEAQRFLAGLQEVVGSGRALILDLNVGIPANSTDKDRHIGWRETDDSVYLLPTMARQMIERHTGQKFNSAHQLHRQLDELGLIQSKSDKQTKVIRVSGAGSQRVLHLSKDAMEPQP